MGSHPLSLWTSVCQVCLMNLKEDAEVGGEKCEVVAVVAAVAS